TPAPQVGTERVEPVAALLVLLFLAGLKGRGRLRLVGYGPHSRLSPFRSGPGITVFAHRPGPFFVACSLCPATPFALHLIAIGVSVEDVVRWLPGPVNIDNDPHRGETVGSDGLRRNAGPAHERA